MSFPVVSGTYKDILDKARCREFIRLCRENDFTWVSNDLDVQERYLDIRISGESHNLAEILAFRKFPSTRTDREWNMGHCNGNQFSGGEHSRVMGDYYKNVAESQGASVTGKVYKSGLADYPGDPRAWVSDRHDAQKLVEERGWSSQGMVNVAPRVLDCPDDPAVSPELIAGEVQNRVDVNEMLGCKDAAELTDKLTKLRGWKPDNEIGV